MEIIEKRNGLLNSNNWKLQYFTLSNLQNDILCDRKSTNVKDLSNTINQSEQSVEYPTPQQNTWNISKVDHMLGHKQDSPNLKGLKLSKLYSLTIVDLN